MIMLSQHTLNQYLDFYAQRHKLFYHSFCFTPQNFFVNNNTFCIKNKVLFFLYLDYIIKMSINCFIWLKKILILYNYIGGIYMFENKKIFILGMARSGYQAARVLAKRNNTIVLNDKNADQYKKHIK